VRPACCLERPPLTEGVACKLEAPGYFLGLRHEYPSVLLTYRQRPPRRTVFLQPVEESHCRRQLQCRFCRLHALSSSASVSCYRCNRPPRYSCAARASRLVPSPPLLAESGFPPGQRSPVKLRRGPPPNAGRAARRFAAFDFHQACKRRDAVRLGSPEALQRRARQTARRQLQPEVGRRTRAGSPRAPWIAGSVLRWLFYVVGPSSRRISRDASGRGVVKPSASPAGLTTPHPDAGSAGMRRLNGVLAEGPLVVENADRSGGTSRTCAGVSAASLLSRAAAADGGRCL